MGHLTAPLRTLTRTHQRWAYLIIGGALSIPYLMAALVLATLLHDLTTPTPALTNPLTRTPRPHRTGGGHGLKGTQERADLIGAHITHGPHNDHWATTLHLAWKDTP